MNKEGGEVNNRYTLRNRKHNNRAGGEEENDEEVVAEEEEDDEGEEGRDQQRRRVDEKYNKDLLKRIRTMTGWKCQEI
jgi:hypothetical protein